uniref:Uncharacterized protein n=1 Tax=Stomoxys calcitrans TaxID=35570 RepID=A0A1I8PG11_STOCA
MFFKWIWIGTMLLILTSIQSKELPAEEKDTKEADTNMDTKMDNNGIATTEEEVIDLPMELNSANISKLYWGFSDIFGNKHKETPLFSGPYNDVPAIGGDTAYGSFDRHPCRRVCQQGKSQSCYYRIIVHYYQTLGPECQSCLYDPSTCESENCIYGDGVPNEVIAVNRQWPAPSIEVCEGDTIVADVINYLREDTTTHWHGLHMSQTPDMDGVPFVTQYPISPGEVQRYTFPVDRSGSVWYHSHMGWQRALGAAGALIIRQTKENNRHANLYDYDLVEHTMIIQDTVYSGDFTRPRNLVINGKGRNHLNSWPDNDSRHRYERINVSPGMRYRMRVISNGVFNCPVEFSIENHKMLMIASDGNDLKPVYGDKFFLTSAERFDFILHANQYTGNYWIRVKGYNDCENLNLYQGAILHYRGASRRRLPAQQITELSNEIKSTTSEAPVGINTLTEVSNLATRDERNDVPTLGLQSLTPLEWPAYTKFITYYMSFGQLVLDGEEYLQVDEITFAFPSVSLLQGRHLFNDDNYFCNRTGFQAAGINCRRTNCECTNVVRMPAYKPIELVVANYMNSTHPFHAHGFTFRLVGQDVLGNINDVRNIRELDLRGYLKRTPDNFPAVEKDTIQVPPLGYIIIRFISDNPGFWALHCHIERHSLLGMTAVLKIGENYQMKKITPKLNC